MSFPASVAAVRQAERSAVAAGTAEYTLMLRAGRQAADIISRHYRDAVRILVLCGGGNNGGDALTAARFLFERFHYEVIVYTVKPLEQLTGCAARAAADLPAGVTVEKWECFTAAGIRPGDVIVEGLLGIGFSGGALRVEVQQLIKTAAASGCPIVALDLPGGINGDTGEASVDGAVNADLTICFGSLKHGLFKGSGSRLRGKLRLVDIGLELNETVGYEVFTNLDAAKFRIVFPFDCHKNSRGRVLIWGGCEDYPGAPVLSACAALHCGSGIVRLVSEAECRSLAPAAVIVKKLLNGSDWGREIKNFYALSDVLAAGCGWGSNIAPEALDTVFEFHGRIILDADALNLASRNIERWKFDREVIITPHWGEASRLADALNLAAADRMELASALADKLQCVVLLKGRDTVIASPEGRQMIIAAGNSKLATAGSGDVLTGIIAAAASSGMPLFEAAAIGAYIHGIAGEIFPGIPIADQLADFAGVVLDDIREKRIY